MEKYKYLFKNISLLTISSFGSKILNFFFVPLYTSILSTEEYGTYDLLNTTIGLLIPILTSGIIESVFRFSLDSNCDRKEVFSISAKIVFKGILAFFTLLIVNYVWGIILWLNEYLIFFSIMYVVAVLHQLLLALARGCEKVPEVSLSGVIHTVFAVVLNVTFLLGCDMGLRGYLLANVLSESIACIYLCCKIKAIDYICLVNLGTDREREMLAYSRPLILNSISWWIISASDRYIVTWICGVAANGIYSVAYKIPTMLSVLQGIFNSAWQISAVKTYDKEDSDGFFQNIYSAYNLIMVFGCSGLIIMTKVIAKLVYANEFYDAWQYVPYLTISVVFGALLGVLGGVFHAVKDSKMQTITTVVGAVVNIVLNLYLTPRMGPMGAVVATMIVYFIMWAIAMSYFKKYMTVNIPIMRDCSAYTILVLQATLLIINGSAVSFGLQIVFVGLLLTIYKKEVKSVLSKMTGRLHAN